MKSYRYGEVYKNISWTAKTNFMLCLVFIFLAGCSTFSERFYVVSADGDMRNYYRTEISGWTFLSSSEFQAGAAPTEVVDSLLGQAKSTLYADNDNQKVKLTKPSGSQAEEQTGENQPLLIDPFTGREMPDQKIVISLSSNPDEIFQSLQGAAASADVSKSVESIVLAQRGATLEGLRSDAQRQQREIEKLAGQLKLESADISNKTQNDLIVLLQKLIASLR